MRISERTVILNLVFFGIPLFFLLMPVSQPYMLGVLGITFHAVLWFLDCVFATHILPLPAPVSWMLVGSIIGGSLAFWTIAPSIGRRHLRSVIATVPFIVLGGIAIIDGTYSILSTPAPVPMQVPATTAAPATTPANQPITYQDYINGATGQSESTTAGTVTGAQTPATTTVGSPSGP